MYWRIGRARWNNRFVLLSYGTLQKLHAFEFQAFHVSITKYFSIILEFGRTVNINIYLVFVYLRYVEKETNVQEL